MDPALNKLLKAIGENGQPDEDLDQYYDLVASKEIPFEDFLPFLRALAARVDSTQTLEVISKLLKRGFNGFFPGMNLEAFSNLYPSELDFRLKVLREITSSKQELRILYIKMIKIKPTSNISHMDQDIWTELIKMKSLNKIEINTFYFLLSDLVDMSKHFPALRILKIVIDSSNLPIEPTEHYDFTPTFKDTFQHLEEFIYSTYPDMLDDPANRYFEQFTNFCITHLPNLRDVRCLNRMFDMTKACEEMKQTSRMKQLQLNPNGLSSLAENAEKFPHIVLLTLNWKSGGVFHIPLDKQKWDSLKKFKKLTHLINYDLNNTGNLEFILSVLGKNLNFLCIDYSENSIDGIDLKVVQERCPKLARLKISNTFVEGNYSLRSFASLLDLKIAFAFDSSNLKLSNLLAAPNLQIVELSGFRVSSIELKQTILLIKTKAILTKVETISLMLDGTMLDYEGGTDAEKTENEFENFCQAVQASRDGDVSVQIDFIPETLYF